MPLKQANAHIHVGQTKWGFCDYRTSPYDKRVFFPIWRPRTLFHLSAWAANERTAATKTDEEQNAFAKWGFKPTFSIADWQVPRISLTRRNELKLNLYLIASLLLYDCGWFLRNWRVWCMPVSVFELFDLFYIFVHQHAWAITGSVKIHLAIYSYNKAFPSAVITRKGKRCVVFFKALRRVLLQNLSERRMLQF